MQDPVPGPLTPPPSQPSCCVLNAQARTAHSLAPDPARGSQVPGGDISWAFSPHDRTFSQGSLDLVSLFY